MWIDSQHTLDADDLIMVASRSVSAGGIISFGRRGETFVGIAGSVAQMRDLRDKLTEWLGPHAVVPAGDQAARAVEAIPAHSEGKVA